MGTLSEWLEAGFMAVFFGGAMLAAETRRRKTARVEPAFLPANVLIWASAGLVFGLGTTFQGRAFHWPLVLITALSILCALILIILYRHERGQEIRGRLDKRQAWTRAATFFLIMLVLVLLLLKFDGLF